MRTLQFTADYALYTAEARYSGTRRPIAPAGVGRVLPQRAPTRPTDPFGTRCWTECYPIRNCNPMTGRCTTIRHCVRKCQGPIYV
jgi:hypothetical protein